MEDELFDDCIVRVSETDRVEERTVFHETPFMIFSVVSVLASISLAKHWYLQLSSTLYVFPWRHRPVNTTIDAARNSKRTLWTDGFTDLSDSLTCGRGCTLTLDPHSQEPEPEPEVGRLLPRSAGERVVPE